MVTADVVGVVGVLAEFLANGAEGSDDASMGDAERNCACIQQGLGVEGAVNVKGYGAYVCHALCAGVCRVGCAEYAGIFIDVRVGVGIGCYSLSGRGVFDGRGFVAQRDQCRFQNCVQRWLPVGCRRL